MTERLEGGSEKGVEREVPLTDEEREYLKLLVSREHIQSNPKSPNESMPTYRLRETLLTKLG